MTDVMTPLERVYSLEASVRLNFATMMEIYKSGGLPESQSKRPWTSVVLACAWPHASLDTAMRKPADIGSCSVHDLPSPKGWLGWNKHAG